MLLVTTGFTWQEFVIAFVGCVLGITFLAAAFSDYFLVKMRMWERWVCGIAALLMVAPGITSTLIGLAMVAPVMLRQLASVRGRAPAAA
jgi:TRAP-type uncharacterized transport system fused permease subunit